MNEWDDVRGKEQIRVIKVLLVDDSPLALVIMKRMLYAAPDIRVVGTARNGKEALKLIPIVDPDVICTDLHMPIIDGLALTKEVMEEYPRPILVISISVQKESENVFKLIEAGAVDVFPKPSSGLEEDYMKQTAEFISRIRILSGVKVFRKKREKPLKRLETTEPIIAVPGYTVPKILGIGTSTGGPNALQRILLRLPSDFPLPVMCVQHISEGFLLGFVEWLQGMSKVKIEIARQGELPLPGHVYFPPENFHLIIDSEGKFRYSSQSPVDGHRPSATVMFHSMAQQFGSSAIGVLLTGMGRDGADGMKAIRDAGGITIAQDEKTSIVFSMPKHAIELDAAQYVLPVDEIARAILTLVNKKNDRSL
ncbi:MAG: chemotaxis-specific protein-glutamate methyltransferase CheB [Candidatus Schekmanbacteria bacterium]|nr:chemotaxis-specific protein-glutamate methyltransferase CheB [Candidatus Schekmanbacteria bacterium]